MLLQSVLLNILATLLWVAPDAIATPAGPLQPRASAVPPTNDPFYTPPAGFKSKAPGTILKHRPVPNPIAAFTEFQANIKAAYQLLYATRNSVGHPEAAVTTILIPYNPDFTKLLSYQVAYDSSYINCDPSYALQKGSSSNGTSEDILFMAGGLREGWVVSTPDYEGSQAAFTAGPGSGQATLDSIRAAIASNSVTGVSNSADVVMWGYSGGALASEWASELQSAYAPDLNPRIKGAALGGLTPNVTSVLNTVNKGPFAGLIPTGIIGLTNDYANLSNYVQKHLVSSKKADFEAAATQCLDQDTTSFAFQDISTYFDNGLALLNDKIPKSVINAAGIMGHHGTPTIPLYFYKAIGDEMSPIADTNKLYNNYCSKNVDILYEKNTVGEHISEAVLGAPGAFQFIQQRFSAQAFQKSCSQRTVTVADLDPDIIELFGYEIFSALLSLLDQPLGPGSIVMFP